MAKKKVEVWTFCDNLLCFNTYYPSEKNDAIKAGWFIKKDGTSYCPDHVPPAIRAWQAKQMGKKHGTR